MLGKDKRSLAHIERIKELRSIPNADRIEVAKVLGWDVVVLKGEFNVGDLCVYFEIDSVIPKQPWSEFLVNKNKPDKPIRLRTVKLRGQISQGLAMPLTIINDHMSRFKNFDPKEGDDLADIIGVEKYVAPISAELAGKVLGNLPWFVPKTDEERIQNIPDIIKEIAGINLYVTVKLNGTSGSIYFFENAEHPFGVCSRNLLWTDDEAHTLWKLAHKYDLLTKLPASGNYVIQGEVCGPGIQKNQLGLKEHDFFVFNVYDIEEKRYLDYMEFINFCTRLDLKTVPVVMEHFVFTGEETVDDVLQISDGEYDNGHLREGIVIRPMKEAYSETLKGRLSFKAVSNKYLLAGEN